MKWYKRDPDAALAGMAELTFEERGAYNSLLDLLYSRDGNVPDDDAFCARVFHCNPRTWRALKTRLMAKGKVRVIEGQLSANRVANELRMASERIADMSRLGRLSAEKRKHSNGNGQRARPTTASVTTTSTEREEENSSREFSSSLSPSLGKNQPARSLAGAPDGARASKPAKPTNTLHLTDEEVEQWLKDHP